MRKRRIDANAIVSEIKQEEIQEILGEYEVFLVLIILHVWLGFSNNMDEVNKLQMFHDLANA